MASRQEVVDLTISDEEDIDEPTIVGSRCVQYTIPRLSNRTPNASGARPHSTIHSSGYSHRPSSSPKRGRDKGQSKITPSRESRTNIDQPLQRASNALVLGNKIADPRPSGSCSHAKHTDSDASRQFQPPERIDLTPKPSEPDPVRSFELRYKPPQCTECQENGTNCDGMQPCASCDEPGFECRYPGREPTSAISHEPPPQITAYTELPRKSSEGSFDSTKSIPKDQSPSLSLDLDSQLANMALQGEHLPLNDWLPSSLNEMKDLVKIHEENLHSHREYLLQIQLLQAKKHAQGTPTIPESTDTQDKPNPWRKFVKSSPALTASDFGTLQVKSHNSKKKNFVSTRIPVMSFPVDPDAPLLPKYKSIGRMGTSFLSKNVHTLKYMPYFADDEGNPTTDAENERNAELRERYRNKSFGGESASMKELRQQRICLERVWFWDAKFKDLLVSLRLTPNHLASWVRSSAARKCRTCELTFDKVTLVESADELSREEAQRCVWLSEAFQELTSIPVWHFLYQPDNKHHAATSTEAGAPLDLCAICFVHNCLTHGAYVDGDDEANAGGVFVNDPEDENNIRKRAIIKPAEAQAHLCGVFCIERHGFESDSVPPSTFLEVFHVDKGEFDGQYNSQLGEIRTNLAIYKGTTSCGDSCFLDLERRRYWYSNTDIQGLSLKQAHSALITEMIKLHKTDGRLPCELAKITGLPCMQTFYHILQAHRKDPHPTDQTSDESTIQNGIGAARKVTRPVASYNTEMSHELDHRATIMPCQHEGPCVAGSGCACAKDKVHCERFCACDKSCKRRFRGCRCKMDNPQGVCFMDERCECFANHRECSPWLCDSCGVLEVLDPPNKYNDAIRVGRCQNAKIQLDLPAKTIKAPSEVQGWGLFAGQDLPKHAFIGEYKGEIISAGPWSESDRRGVAYHNGGLEYLFTINKEQEIDGSSFGNKTRFMNNSQLEKHINVASQKLIANHVQRIMFYAKRAIKAGEELLYNYNYPASVTEAFWERGEKPNVGHRDSSGHFATPAKPRISNRVARQAGAIHAGRPEDEEAGVVVRAKKADISAAAAALAGGQARGAAVKRKRRVVFNSDDEDGESDDRGDEAATQLAGELASWDIRNGRQSVGKGKAVRVEEEEEYENDVEEDEDEGSVELEIDDDEEEEEEEESESVSEDAQPVRKRAIHRERDRRIGGEAQRRAAATRRARKERGERY